MEKEWFWKKGKIAKMSVKDNEDWSTGIRFVSHVDWITIVCRRRIDTIGFMRTTSTIYFYYFLFK
jgi:hypothetical protein